MLRYIFNDDFFNSDDFTIECDNNRKIDKKHRKEQMLTYVRKTRDINTVNLSVRAFDNKRSNGDRGKKFFNKHNYEDLINVNHLLMLDTDKLILKMFKRVNLDLNPNSKFVLHMMLLLLAPNDPNERRESVTAKELFKRYNLDEKTYEIKKIQNCLENDVLPTEEKTVHSKKAKKVEYIYENVYSPDPETIKDGDMAYKINLTTLIKYCNLEFEN